MDRTDPFWRKSTFSGDGNCVEIATEGEVIFVRDSKDPDGPMLRFTRPEWKAFCDGMADGQFDIG